MFVLALLLLVFSLLNTGVAVCFARVSASWFRLSDAQPGRSHCEIGWSKYQMHRTLRLLAVLFTSACALAQSASAPADPYKPVLDRLQSITVIPLPVWQAHAADLAHGEDPAVTTSGWQEVKLKEDWQGSRWLRQTFEVPAQSNGYSLQGARVTLDLHVSSDDAIQVSVFANGSMLSRTDEDGQVPITLIENAQPGQKLVLAVRVLDAGGGGCCGGNSTRIEHAELRIEPPASRPDPALLRLQILSAETLIAAYPDGKAERQQKLDIVVKAINLAALDRGDQQAFDASLREAQTKFDALRPYMKQFSIAAVGNSHIDMAWLWPWTETVEVVRNTFGTALELMREYPDFKFTASAAQAYEWIEEKYPAMFREIQQRVKEGRWEVIGGMWVDLDTALRWQKGDLTPQQVQKRDLSGAPNLVYPQINFSTAAQYFADLEKNESELKIPTWDGEL